LRWRGSESKNLDKAVGCGIIKIKEKEAVSMREGAEVVDTQEVWDSMSPEARVCDGRLQYLSEEILTANWADLSPTTQDHLILLLS